MIRHAVVALALAILLSSPAGAITLQPSGNAGEATSTGAATVDAGARDKVSINFPPAVGGGAGFGGTSASLPLLGSASVLSNQTFTAVAGPGDAPGATRCVDYDFSSTRTFTGSGTGQISVALGLSGGAGFSSDFSAIPVQMVAPTPATVRVVRASGPTDILFSVGPRVEILGTTQTPLSVFRKGRFCVQAGDQVVVDLRMSVAGRTSGDVSINSFVSGTLRLTETGAAIPALMPGGPVALAAMLLLAGLASLALRRRARR